MAERVWAVNGCVAAERVEEAAILAMRKAM